MVLKNVLLHCITPLEVYSANITKKPYEINQFYVFLPFEWVFPKVPKSNQKCKNSEKSEKIKNIKKSIMLDKINDGHESDGK